jgi:cell division protein FtsW (lipid II flippase)
MLRIVADASDRANSPLGIAMIQTASTTGSSTLRSLAFVPEPHTDFIFAVSDGASIVPLAMALLVLLVLIWYVRRRRTRSRSLDE